MSLVARTTKPKKELDNPVDGTHMARLVGLTDLGHQPGFVYEGKEIESEYKIEYTYELVNSLMKDGRPHWVSETIKVNDFVPDHPGGFIATMMLRARSLNPENPDKDATKHIGKPCMVTVTISEKGYANVKGQAAVTGCPIGMEIPELVNDTFIFDMDAPDLDLWATFPEFKQNKIKEALNFEETELFRQLILEGEV